MHEKPEPRDPETHAIIGAAMEVHRQLGPGFLEAVCHAGIIVELKALSALSGIERAQILNYLKATGHRRGLLINFGAKSLQFERFIFANAKSSTDFADSTD